jgi:deoxyribonuclease IV
MSIAGGLALALERGATLGCGAVQIFLKNHRQWAAAPLRDEDARAFRSAHRRLGRPAVFAHASYLLNLAGPVDAAWRTAVDALTDELERGEALGLGSVIVHAGSHMGAGHEGGLRRVAAAADEALRRTAGYRIKLALENSAGAGHGIGARAEDLARVLGASRRPERLGICLDTCHLFAAGYDLRTPSGYRAALDAWVDAVGADRVLAFHLNDARAALGSGLDRHEHIGRGRLGLAPFRLLLGDARFAGVPKVLETPKEPMAVADARNLAVLRRLRRRRPRRLSATS